MRYSTNVILPGAYAAVEALDDFVATAGLDPQLLDLVRTRASQLNGCAYCVDMHSRDLRERGESEQRVYAIAVWRETPFFTPRERAALAWTEAVTLVAGRGVSDAAYAEVRAQFEEREVATLTLAIAAINTWNRISIASGLTPSVRQAPETAGVA